MYKVLVLGCGNIGAQYDFNNNEVQTHVKAWSLNSLVSLSVFDVNFDLKFKVANRYNCNVVEDISVNTLSNFDIVCICTPTSTHYEILNNTLLAGVKTIICEKPIAYDRDEIIKLEEIYSKGESKIIVNYIRRFQPEFINLQKTITGMLKKDKLTNVSIRYQRGLINNCSHAIDLIEFLFNESMNLKEIQFHNDSFDQFKDDPTVSLMSFWNDVNVNILGLSDVLFSQFEIDLYFENQKIQIKNAGDSIEFYRAEKGSKNLSALIYQKEKTRTGCLKNYMIPVINHAINVAERKVLFDNFATSVQLNLRLLSYIKF